MRSPEARTVQRWGNHPDALHKAVVVANRCENTGELVVIVHQDGSPMIFILWDTKSGSSLRNNKWAKPDKRYFICEHKAPSCWLNFLRTKCFSHAFFHIVFYLYIRYTSVTAEVFLHATISYPSSCQVLWKDNRNHWTWRCVFWNRVHFKEGSNMWLFGWKTSIFSGWVAYH